jgi:V-type H+-transporting ATPase subunit D
LRIQRSNFSSFLRLKKVQGKKKREAAERDAVKQKELPPLIDDLDNTAPLNLLSSKDEDVIF